ncbi:membrane-associated proteins in eicosanoid and glutathione metabolism [Mycena rosella]|uniref:Membrane-associated proteins in eicosanoid and glutathione metabolism n=1 Tax=Mycena rosella TaxID=1033263 RepID=A0AAD7DZC8_MYCRO|nr:membrane-associated proteins in eicosanoid and glutathione metabolism [Mycena rosella]
MSTIIVPAGFTPLFVPRGFSYVAAALVSTVFLITGQVIAVSQHRKAAGIPYPHLYADKAEMAASPAAVKFNCVQRAHQNTLEKIAQMYMMTAVLGLRHPVLAAAALGAWVASRVAYTVGYASGTPDNRNNIFTRLLYGPSTFTLCFGSLYTVYELVAAGV